MARATQREDGRCSCTVPLNEISGTLGMPPGHEANLVRRLGFELAVDWAGRPAMAMDQAAEFATAYRRDTEAHTAKHDAYVRYLAKTEQKAQEDRAEAARKAREESRARTAALREEERVLNEKEAARDAEERLEELQKLHGAPVSFQDFQP